MHLKVPEVKRCCFCLPLRYGIMVFGIINIILSLLAVSCLVVTTELKKSSLTGSTSLEVVTSTVLYSLLGLGVILNVVLLVGGYQKDILMLRLYNYYTVVTIIAAFVPLLILLYRRQFVDVSAGLLAVVMQIYVSVLVRSETMKLEKMLMNTEESLRHTEDNVVDAPDTVTLL